MSGSESSQKDLVPDSAKNVCFRIQPKMSGSGSGQECLVPDPAKNVWFRIPKAGFTLTVPVSGVLCTVDSQEREKILAIRVIISCFQIVASIKGIISRDLGNQGLIPVNRLDAYSGRRKYILF